jgi:autotransporter translocation and assembly factor TamB
MRITAFFGSLALLTCLMVSSALAADVDGKWTAQMPGRDGNTMEVTFNFKADGATLTGTVSNPRGEAPIKEGKVDGDNISFAQTFERGGNSMKIIYKGTVSGDTIEFTRARDGGEGQAQKFTAKRAK